MTRSQVKVLEASAARTREAQGWREGRPVEDPEKTKRWGFVTAKPSEFLVHVRRGRVLGRSSGQGASCFKWPRDSVAIVPTSFQRLQFTADQVTVEKVGVEVTGLAVYRIAEPLMAYRVLNFSYPERAQEKLEETLVQMLIGATRRLVANLTVEACFRERKEALAGELLREIAPVLGGEGRPDDPADRGWGVVLDTLEVQEVRVLSESVFTTMQAPFRASVEREAREARAEADRAGALRETASAREVEQARLDAEAELQRRRDEIAREEAERQATDALERGRLATERARAEAAAEEARGVARLEAQAGLRAREQALRAAEAEAEATEAREAARRRAEVEVERARLDAQAAQAALEAAGVRAEAQAQEGALERARWGLTTERRRAEAEAEAAARGALARAAWVEAQVQRQEAEAEARVLLAEHLPELAQAVGARFGEVKVTQIGGEGGPFASIAQAVAAVVDLVRDA